MKKEVHHHCFTLSVLKVDGSDYVPVLDFSENESFDQVLLTMISLEDHGLITSLSCETWSTFEEVSEDD